MMAKTIDMQFMRYINLFEKLCKVSTTDCFVYNNVIIFAVQKKFVAKAIGKNGAGIRKISEVFGRRIKVVEMPQNKIHLEKFIAKVVDPINFAKFEIKDGVAIISASRQSRVSLIGKKRCRQKELEDILRKFFGINRLRIA